MDKPTTTDHCKKMSLNDIAFCMVKYMQFKDVQIKYNRYESLASGAWLILMLHDKDGLFTVFNGQFPETIREKLIDWLQQNKYLQ